MKKIPAGLFLAAMLALPASVTAEITVLKGERISSAYELEQNEWKKSSETQKSYLIIDAAPGEETPYFDVDSVIIIFLDKEKKNGQTFKYYERADFSGQSIIQILDLGNKNEVAMTVGYVIDDGRWKEIEVGNLKGKFKKSGFFKTLNGVLVSQKYENYIITEFGETKWNLSRTKKFDDEQLDARQIADAIEEYLIDKGYESEPED